MIQHEHDKPGMNARHAKAPAAEKPRYAVPAVDSMLDIVEHLTRNPRTFTVTELSRELGISNNLVFRIIRRLVARGYVEADADGGYQLGSGFFRMGMLLAPRFDIRLRARPHVEWLSRQTCETATLQVPDNALMLVLDSVPAATDCYFHIAPGCRLLYHCNAFGKCILAFRTADEVAAILPEKLEIKTPNTIATRSKLLAQLEPVRATGLGYDWGEYTRGVFCIAAPIFDCNGTVCAAVGISGLADVQELKRRKQLETAVRVAAKRTSEALAYAGDFFNALDDASPIS